MLLLESTEFEANVIMGKLLHKKVGIAKNRESLKKNL